MKTVSIQPEPRLTKLLPGCTFADAYGIGCDAASIDARGASHTIFESPPAWATALLAARNGIVRHLGLKTGPRPADLGAHGRVGLFPVLAESSQEVLMGMDDRHLDFRVAVTMQPGAAGARQVMVTTLVRTNNLLGRVYLAVILPFHRLIVRAFLSRAARTWNG